MLAGLLISYHHDLAAGATIVLVEVGAFFAVLATSVVRAARAPAAAAARG